MSDAIADIEQTDTVRVETRDGDELLGLVKAAYEPDRDESDYGPDHVVELIEQGGHHSFGVPADAEDGIATFLLRSGGSFSTLHGEYSDGSETSETDTSRVATVDIIWSPTESDAAACPSCGCGAIFYRAGYNECVDCASTWGPRSPDEADPDTESESKSNTESDHTLNTDTDSDSDSDTNTNGGSDESGQATTAGEPVSMDDIRS